MEQSVKFTDKIRIGHKTYTVAEFMKLPAEFHSNYAVTIIDNKYMIVWDIKPRGTDIYAGTSWKKVEPNDVHISIVCDTLHAIVYHGYKWNGQHIFMEVNK